MGLKALKDYGLKFNGLKAVAKEMNEADVATAISIKVGTKGEVMLSEFMDAIDSVEDVTDIPEAVSLYYDEIPQEAFDDSDTGDNSEEGVDDTEPEKEEETTEGGVESDCPAFLTGCDDNEPDCQECATDTPEEYEACKEATTVKATKKKAKKEKTKAAKKGAGKRSRYGHMPGSMAGCIDDMVYEGATKEAIGKALMKKFKRSKERATSKVNSHLLTLANKKGITIKEKKDGSVKAKEKYAEGFNKDNTASGMK